MKRVRLITGWAGDYYQSRKSMVDLCIKSWIVCYPDYSITVYLNSEEDRKELQEKFAEVKIVKLTEDFVEYGKYYDAVRFVAFLLEQQGSVLWFEPDTICFKPFDLDKFVKSDLDWIGHFDEKDSMWYSESKILKELQKNLYEIKELRNLKPGECQYNLGTLFVAKLENCKFVFHLILEIMKELASLQIWDFTKHVVLTQTIPQLLLEQRGLTCSTAEKVLGISSKDLQEKYAYHLCMIRGSLFTNELFWKDTGRSLRVYEYLLKEKLLKTGKLQITDFKEALDKIRPKNLV